MKLTDYINKHHDGNKAAFARSMKLANPQQVSPWIRGGWIVFEGKLYSPKRDIAIAAEISHERVD